MIFTVSTIILRYRYYDTEDFSSISIIVVLNITIYDNIVILPSPIQHTFTKYNSRQYFRPYGNTYSCTLAAELQASEYCVFEGVKVKNSFAACYKRLMHI